ncbi:efflux RND transporter permease subunit [Phaeovulum vinaykumarii]|uniref:efflux RND transporter permease subunit n=1 Tax=Phaeovulum vinaykumarii TaxID=407234 RepID=UPI0009709F34|nr:efflux RND transporter permease subunit [Phaeovulum vinaykumarii]
MSLFTRHKTLANILLVVILVAGLAAMPRLRAQFFPDMAVDEISVSVIWEGASPEDVDRAIVQVLEPSLLVVEGVESSSSRASEGRAVISLEFEPGWDMGRAVDEVETAVAQAEDLPEEAEDPEVTRGAWRDTVTDLVLTGPMALDQLGQLADELVARLYAEGVTRTTIQGFAAPQVVVEVPSENLVRHDLTLREIAAVIGAEAATAPAGDVASGGARVRTGEERRKVAEIAGLVLRAEPDGSLLTLGDVAQIRREGADRNRAYFVGDDPAVSINVSRSAQGDAIGLQQKVEKVVAEMQATLPASVTIELTRTRAEMIGQRLSLLLENGAMGLGLVLVLLFLFLNARTAFWVAMGIPVAMMAAIAMMYMGGLTLNVISIFALIITLGIVVDDAIVVGEHADFRARHLREPPLLAAENGALRMLAPVFASTLTTIIAFAGLVIIGGRMGDMIRDIPLTVIAVLAASLVECFLILPNHMVHALGKVGHGAWYDLPSQKVNEGFEWLRVKVMRPFTRFVIRARYPVLAMAGCILAWQVSWVISGKVQWRFFNPPEQGSMSANFSMLPGASREDTFEMMRALQASVETLGQEMEDKHGVNPILFMIGQVGGNSGRGLAGADTKDQDLLGSVSIELIDADLRPYSSMEFAGRLQAAAPRHPLLEEISMRAYRSGGTDAAISVDLSGAEARELKSAAEALKAELARYPEVSAIEDNLAFDKAEMVLDLTAQGEALGFTLEALARDLRARMAGIEAATFPDGPRSASIRVELPPEDLRADFTERLYLRSPSGNWVPLSDIVSVRMQDGFSSIRREDGLRVVQVTAELSEDNARRATEIMRSLREEILPRIAEQNGIAWTMTGMAEQERDFMSDALLGLVLCLLGIYIVLSWIFASWTRPMVVMSVIPFGLVGAIWGHWFWDLPLSMFAVVGLIGMSGIIINDSIVLVTTVDQHARRHGLHQAIVEAVSERLRPVFLTTATTVLGLAPILYERSNAATFLKPTVITLVYGLGFGLIIVLCIVPAILAVQMDAGRQIRAFQRGLRVPGLRLAFGTAALALAGAFALTLGRAMATGAELLPALATYAGLVVVIVALAGLAAPVLRRRARTGATLPAE